MAKSKLQRDLERAHQATRDAKNAQHRDHEAHRSAIALKDAEILNLKNALADARSSRGPVLTTGEIAEVVKASTFLTTLAYRALGTGHG